MKENIYNYNKKYLIKNREKIEKKSNFSIKNISKKCNIIARKKQLNSINITRIFQTSINVNEHRFIIMIDSSTTKNFMFQKLINKKNSLFKKNIYNLIVIDENSLLNKNEKINIKIILLSIVIQQHHKKLIFNIIRMITHNIVLKMF